MKPYIIQLEGQWKKYNSAKGVLVSKAILNEACYEENNCLVPGMKRFESLFTEDPISKKILQNYFTFLHESDWCGPEVFDRLNEMLTALMEKEDQERKNTPTILVVFVSSQNFFPLRVLAMFLL